MKHLLHRLAGHVHHAVTRGKVLTAKLSSNSKFTLLQLSGLQAEIRDGIRLFLPYGMSALPKAGDLILLQVGGSRSHLVALAADDGGLRISDLQTGEFGWKDANARQIVFRSDHIEVTAPTGNVVVTTAAGNVNLNGVTIDKDGNIVAPAKITSTGDIKSTGGNVSDQVRSMAADRAKYNAHKHTGVQTGGGTSGTTDTPE